MSAYDIADVEIPQSIIEILKRPLPQEAVKPHPTKTYLSTIKVPYVVERLNEAFGINGWRDKYEIVEKQQGMVVVHGFLSIPKYGIERNAFGGNDNPDLGDAYKGACTDSLSKMASFIGIGMDVYKGERTQPQGQPQQSTERQPMKNVEPRKGGAWPTEMTGDTLKCYVLSLQEQPANYGATKIEVRFIGLNGVETGLSGFFKGDKLADVKASEHNNAIFKLEHKGKYTNIVSCEDVFPLESEDAPF